MLFINRGAELAALRELDIGLAVVWGRRRIGKTRLLLEWCDREDGLYTVADQSSPEVQRAYLAGALGARLPGFGDVTYPDWERLLSRLAADASAHGFRGPVVLDELPYLVASSPELPSVLQRWIDHDAARARLRVAIAGSSQRMMQGLALAPDAPLYGRARVLLDIQPLAPRFLADALDHVSGVDLVEQWTAWGGVPRYWELAASRRGPARNRIAALVLDPLGPLFSEAERLLMEESPSALEVRPVLDAIGAGAHRVSEIAGRLGRPATSLGKPLDRLLGMGLIRREAPYGDPARGGKRSLYKIDDPFLRLWFRVVAPNRAALTAGTRASRMALLAPHWDTLVAQAWEDLCRAAVPRLARGALARLGPWSPARRYWHGAEPEWDVVADAVQGSRLLVGEAWFSRKPVTPAALKATAASLSHRPLPPGTAGRDIVRALFVPRVAAGAPRVVAGVHVVIQADVLR
ncbi:MAG: ATP-binding protein [Vicinamibacterales bacterium]